MLSTLSPELTWSAIYIHQRGATRAQKIKCVSVGRQLGVREWMAGHMPVNVMFRPLDKHKGHKVSTNYSSPTPEFLGAPCLWPCMQVNKQVNTNKSHLSHDPLNSRCTCAMVRWAALTKLARSFKIDIRGIINFIFFQCTCTYFFPHFVFRI